MFSSHHAITSSCIAYSHSIVGDRMDGKSSSQVSMTHGFDDTTTAAVSNIDVNVLLMEIAESIHTEEISKNI